jgi:hypothetical protein
MPDGEELRMEFEPWGPDEGIVEETSTMLVEHPRVREYLGDTDHRLISLRFADPDGKVEEPLPPDPYRATFYDYTNNRTIEALGLLSDRELLEVAEFGHQPLPSEEEYARAVEVLGRSEFGSAIAEQQLLPVPTVPPLVETELPDGRIERTVAVGLVPRDERESYRLVGVNLIRHEIEHVEPEGGADQMCGFPWAPGPSVRNAPGEVWVTVSQGGTVLWRFLARRPAASSGTNGSGVELRYVDYRGKRVLYQAHVPILNVSYDANRCGPYLDWQNQEGQFEANGMDVAPGFRLCTAPAKTILDSGSDAGNFNGVAIYIDGQEVVLVSEMNAGWYRYISSWRLHADGTIRPRFGFTAVQHPCVCNRHHHHVFWRLDFDIRSPSSNLVQEFNDPPLFGGNWHDKMYEIKRFRDYVRNRKWRVMNTSSGEGYEIVPGGDDGVAYGMPDWPFPQGDLWIVRYKPGAEIDNGVVATGPPYEANIDNFRNGEFIKNQDVVVWYGAHFTHEIAHHAGHTVGPDLVPFNW